MDNFIDQIINEVNEVNKTHKVNELQGDDYIGCDGYFKPCQLTFNPSKSINYTTFLEPSLDENYSQIVEIVIIFIICFICAALLCFFGYCIKKQIICQKTSV